MPLVATSEMGTAQTVLDGVVGPRHLFIFDRRSFWKEAPQRVKASYLKSILNSSEFLSSVEHV